MCIKQSINKNEIIVRRPKVEEKDSIYNFFNIVIEDTWVKNGLGDLKEFMEEEKKDKEKCLMEDFNSSGVDRFFYIAEYHGKIIGSIEYGIANQLIREGAKGELNHLFEIGTVFILPEFQGQGLVSLLFRYIFQRLYDINIVEICFDSGYPSAQRIWTKKFGEPQYFLKDYWNEGAHHMIWVLNVKETLIRYAKPLEERSLEELYELFPIILKEHNPEYFSWFDDEKIRLKKCVDETFIARISHIGSSPVPGLLAKPTVDIQLEVYQDTNIDALLNQLKKDGWILMSDVRDPLHLSLNKGYTPIGFDDRVFHLHVRYLQDSNELYFKDYLCDFPDVAYEYRELKRKLFNSFEHDRDGYTKNKHDFVMKYTEIAKVYYGHKYHPNFHLIQNEGTPLSTENGDYLEETDIINFSHKAIQDLALALKEKSDNTIILVKNTFEYVRDNISHSADINGEKVASIASDVLEIGEGICYAKSHLLAALLRANRIPCGFCYQKLILDDENAPYLIIHGLNAAFVENKWIRLDSRGNKEGVNAQFSMDIEQLAFEVREELGEEDILVVFDKPDAHVIQALTQHSNVNDLFDNLPRELEYKGR